LADALRMEWFVIHSDGVERAIAFWLVKEYRSEAVCGLSAVIVASDFGELGVFHIVNVFYITAGECQASVKKPEEHSLPRFPI